MQEQADQPGGGEFESMANHLGRERPAAQLLDFVMPRIHPGSRWSGNRFCRCRARRWITDRCSWQVVGIAGRFGNGLKPALRKFPCGTHLTFGQRNTCFATPAIGQLQPDSNGHWSRTIRAGTKQRISTEPDVAVPGFDPMDCRMADVIVGKRIRCCRLLQARKCRAGNTDLEKLSGLPPAGLFRGSVGRQR